MNPLELALEVTARRAVGSVNLPMAVHASIAHQVLAGVQRSTGGADGRQSTLATCRIDAGWCTAGMGAVMALLAEERRT